MAGETLKLFVIAGEESGDRLATDLVAEMSRRYAHVEIAGIGGDGLKSFGLDPLFPMDEISLMGLTSVVVRLPNLLKRIAQASAAAISFRPDAVILVDAPDFNLRVAKRIRARDPSIPIIKWVSPSVWAWRPGRAKAMVPHVDHILALLPFEPEVHKRLGGPPCTYTGHPLLSRLKDLRPQPGERVELADADPPSLLVLPGSRRGELKLHVKVFGEALSHAAQHGAKFTVTVPTLERIRDSVEQATRDWPFPVEIVSGEAERYAAYRKAHAALAASGTVTLELALAGVPMAVGYGLDAVSLQLTRFIRIWSVILPNLILGRPAIREYLGLMFIPDALGAGIAQLLRDTPERRAMIESLKELDACMDTGDRSPAEIAADTVVETIAGKRRRALPAG
ncbi:MAG: lipid-A-disaccharide synthase [Tepidamorphaceae bacterium]|nr:lipid-A-disaccharide synthase [Rhodobiaceae bacterium]